jgi:predicted DsbA family dithiol-disulfide isomerase
VRQFPLHPEIPERGATLEELFGPKNPRIDGARARLVELTEAEGLPYRDRAFVSNSRKAQELGKLGEAQGVTGIHDALFSAYFVAGDDIGDLDVLERIAEAAGVRDARRALENGEFSAAVDEDWAFARRIGVTGVPTYLCDGRAIVGAQPYALLERLVQVAGAEPRVQS